MITGRRISFKGWLAILAIPPLILAVSIGWLSSRVARESDLTESKAETLRSLRTTLIALLDAETGQRGYIITGDLQYLDPYRRAQIVIPERLNELRQLVARGWISGEEMARIESLTSAKLEEMRQSLLVYESAGQVPAIEFIDSKLGKTLMDDLRSEIQRLDQANSDQMVRGRIERDRTSAILSAVAFLSVLVTAGGLWGLYRFGRAQERERGAVEKLALETSNQHLGEFAHMAAHDLQSPARSALSLVQLARRPGADEAQRERLLVQAEAAMQRQMNLIQALLAYQRVDGEQLPPPVPTPLNGVIQQATENLRDLIEKEQAVVSCKDLPVVPGHAELLILLFQNLIENGVKYARAGVRPQIQITAARRDEEWVIAVQDNGQGFDEQYREQIFLPFRRLHDVSTSGSGIGLATCVKVAKLHHGRIWVDSNIGRGSQFFFAMPLS